MQEAKERKIDVQEEFIKIPNTFTIDTGLSVIDIDIDFVLQDYGKGYNVIKELSIEGRI